MSISSEMLHSIKEVIRRGQLEIHQGKALMKLLFSPLAKGTGAGDLAAVSLDSDVSERNEALSDRLACDPLFNAAKKRLALGSRLVLAGSPIQA